MKNCINCGKESFGLLCFRCRRKVPSGFNKKCAPEDLLSEITRNELLKQKFQSDRKLGRLSVDTVNGIFHIDNGYYRFADISKYSFYASEPRFPYGMNRNYVYEDIYFAFTLRDGCGGNQERRVRKLQSVRCQYTNTGRHVSIEPPAGMIGMNQLFMQMMDKEQIMAMAREYCDLGTS